MKTLGIRCIRHINRLRNQCAQIVDELDRLQNAVDKLEQRNARLRTANNRLEAEKREHNEFRAEPWRMEELQRARDELEKAQKWFAMYKQSHDDLANLRPRQ